MKKPVSKKSLNLDTTTVRKLGGDSLTTVAGGGFVLSNVKFNSCGTCTSLLCGL